MIGEDPGPRQRTGGKTLPLGRPDKYLTTNVLVLVCKHNNKWMERSGEHVFLGACRHEKENHVENPPLLERGVAQ